MEDRPKVKVLQGHLAGTRETTPSGFNYYSFQGIPYAKPPVGKLRFKDPQYPDNWSGVLDASKPGEKCAQIDPFRPRKFEGSEDCLYLNVYTPNLRPKAPLPVMVFVYGGKFLAGYGDYYRPDYFIDKNVLIVTMNYRVSILGFLCLNTAEVPGNAGQKDVVFSLRWVQKNIEFFGGDKNNVTIFGESAGGGVVSSFLTSPMTDGLFHKVIAESGSCVNDIYLTKANLFEIARNIVKYMGEDYKTPEDILEFFQNSNVEDLLDAVNYFEVTKLSVGSILTAVKEKQFPNVEAFLIEEPLLDIKVGNYKKVPMILGYANKEGGFFIMNDFDGNILYVDMNQTIPQYTGIDVNSVKGRNFVRDVKKHYFGDPDVKIDEKCIPNLVELYSEHYFTRDINRLLDFTKKYQDNVFFYQFSYVGSMSNKYARQLSIQGAVHTDILPYQFYRPKKASNLTESDRKIVNMISNAWANFVKTGNPTWPNQETKWLPVSENNKFCLDINTDIKLIEDPAKPCVDFWKNIVNKYTNETSKL